MDNTNHLKCRVCKKHKSEVEFPFKNVSVTERGKACKPCRESENAAKRQRRAEGKGNKDPLEIAEAGVLGKGNTASEWTGMVTKELSWKAMLKDLEGTRVEGGRYMESFIVSLPDAIVWMEGEDTTDEEPVAILRGEREQAQAIANCVREVSGFRFKSVLSQIDLVKADYLLTCQLSLRNSQRVGHQISILLCAV